MWDRVGLLTKSVVNEWMDAMGQISFRAYDLRDMLCRQKRYTFAKNSRKDYKTCSTMDVPLALAMVESVISFGKISHFCPLPLCVECPFALGFVRFFNKITRTELGCFSLLGWCFRSVFGIALDGYCG